LEYWIIDLISQKVTVLEWVEGLDEEQVYLGEDIIVSTLLGKLDLTASRLLQGR
jgi:Uma2 family endonuclease